LKIVRFLFKGFNIPIVVTTTVLLFPFFVWTLLVAVGSKNSVELSKSEIFFRKMHDLFLSRIFDLFWQFEVKEPFDMFFYFWLPIFICSFINALIIDRIVYLKSLLVKKVRQSFI
jgi:Na+/glutamate symporter